MVITLGRIGTFVPNNQLQQQLPLDTYKQCFSIQNSLYSMCSVIVWYIVFNVYVYIKENLSYHDINLLLRNGALNFVLNLEL